VWITSDNKQKLAEFIERKYQQMAFDKEGRDVFLADSPYSLEMAQSKFPEVQFHFTSEF